MTRSYALTRRRMLAASGASAAFAAAAPALLASETKARVVVVGGGFGGATFARFLRAADPTIEVTLIEQDRSYVACPFSNLVFAGMRELDDQTFTYQGVEASGVRVVTDRAIDVDAAGKVVRTESSGEFAYDRLLLAPGIDLNWGALPGYDEAATEQMPHAWKAGPQTALLKDQLEAMDDGGLVVIGAPDNPFRCPPGPYERASMIAHYLKVYKPKSKLLILDAKDKFSKQGLFQQGWDALYGDMIEWVGLSAGGQVVSVDAKSGTVNTDFDSYTPAVANIIPPQKAGVIAERAGVADASGWCPIDPISFESPLQPDIHVLGDASIANAMPKSAFSANAQAKVCAIQVARLLNGNEALATTLANTCYSIIGPDYGISIAGVFKPDGTMLKEVVGSGGVSPIDAPQQNRVLEAQYADDWFRIITHEVFG